jgi:L-arginine dehydrogenase
VDEPKFLDEEHVLQALDRSAVVGALESAFSGLAGDRSVQPAQTVTIFPEERGDCIFYPGLIWDLDLVGIKVSPYISSPSGRHEARFTAYTLLLSVSSGRPKLLCDSLALTTARTAGT